MKFLLIFLNIFLFANGLNHLNKIRQNLGMVPLKENVILDNAAHNHSVYLNANGNQYGHFQIGGKYFTGKTPTDRALYVGYNSRFVIENFAYGDYKNINQSIDMLFSAIYHRFGFLNFYIDEVGIANIGKYYVFEMGNSNLNKICNQYFSNIIGQYYYGVCKDYNLKIPAKTYLNAKNNVAKQNPKIVIFPTSDIKVEPVFYAEEPNPIPYKISGYPVSIQFNPYYIKNVKLLRFEIYHNGNKLNTLLLTKNNDKNHKLTANQFALFPIKRLKWDSKYNVVCEYKIDNQIYTKKWDFYTKPLKNNLITVTKNSAFFIKPNKTYTIYVKPSTNNDTIQNIRYKYPQGVKVNIKLLDTNTFQLKVNGLVGQKVTIFADKRIVFVLE